MSVRAQIRRQSAMGALLLLLVCALSLQAQAQILVDKNPASVGDLVNIRISPALPEQSLVIVTPETTYRYLGGVPENTGFRADVAGTYLVRILDGNALADSATITVLGETMQEQPQFVQVAATELVVSKTQLVIGEPLIIDAPVLNVQSIVVKGPVAEMRYLDSTRPVTYLPPIVGTYDISVRYANGSVQNRSVLVVANGEYSNDPYTQERIEERVLAPLGEPSNASASIDTTVPFVAPSAEEPDMYPLVIKRDGQTVEQTLVGAFDGNAYDAGTYSLDIRPQRGLLKSAHFEGYEQAQGADLKVRIEEVEPESIRGNRVPQTIAAFAIDPSAATFSSGSVTFLAVGIALYKCKEYDFDTRTCNGEQRKIMDLLPGETYTITIDSVDPLFSQSGYLTNPYFDSDTSSWTENTESGTPTYAWTSSDSPQTGVADITLSGSNKNGIGGYNQPFNLTIPSGTSLISVNFSAKWRVSTYSRAGTVHFWIDNLAQTTRLCNTNISFTGTTSWRQENLSAPGNCLLSNFALNTNYSVRLRCTLSTLSGGGQTETCRWDDVNVTVYYNDTQAPVLRTIVDTPDPVNYGSTINFSVNVTDNIAVGTVLIELQGTNRTMTLGPGDIYYYDQLNTALTPGLYYYRIFANDTNNNRISNTTTALNYTVQDSQNPSVTLINPPDNHITPNSSFLAFYNVTDNVAMANCSIRRNSTVVNSTFSPVQSVTLNFTVALASDGHYVWNITCNDTSGNVNVSQTRSIYRDTQAPRVLLNISNNSIVNTNSVRFNFTPQDPFLLNCTLWGNFSGSWARNQTNFTPATGVLNSFAPITLTTGRYLWNVRCFDSAANGAFNATNYTVTVDTRGPLWSNQLITPANTSAYNSSETYRFNITVTDEFASVATVLFEANFTGSFVNYTTTVVNGNYTYSTTNLAAATYGYRWHMNDTVGNTNVTTRVTYVVSKAAPVLNITLNGTYANMTVPIDGAVNVTGALVTPASGIIELYQDGALINSAQNYVSNISTLSTEKRYNFTVKYPATQNFTDGQLTLFADVLDTTPPQVVLNTPANNSIEQGTVIFFFTPYDNVDIGNCTILLDGTLNTTKDVPRNQQANITISGLVDGGHYWDVNCSDLNNNTAINGTARNFTVDTQPPTTFNLIAPTSGNVSANLSPVFVWGQTSDTTFDNYTLQIDNDIGFGSINYQASTNPETNVTYQFALSDQVVWYWRVIAYDRAGNSRTSTQTNNYTTDAASPIITLGSPTQDEYVNRTTLNLTYTITEFTQVLNCSLYGNFTGSWALNQTNTSPNKSATNQFLVTVIEGGYNWSVRCYDEALNVGESSSRLFVADATVPTTFTLGGPPDMSITTDNTPEYNWSPTTDLNFDRYTVEVTDDADFAYANYSFDLSPITNTSMNQTPALTDGTWYWRVIAKDLAGNWQVMHPQFGVDTTPPSVFDLLLPANDSQERNETKLFTWEQSNDANFKNYTLLISDSPTFAWINYSNGTLSKTEAQAWLSLAQNITFYWMVIAYDEANNSRNSTSTFTYLADFTLPNVSNVAPANLSTITSNSAVPFQFNVTDVGTIMNCSVYLNGTLTKTLNNPTKNITQTITTNVENGNWSWYINCTDKAGNSRTGNTRYVFLDVQVPTQILYENSTGVANFTVPSNIGLAYNPDTVENQVSYSIAGTGLSSVVNATHTLNGTGMFIQNNTVVNFSGVFAQSNNNVFYVTWHLYMVNASGWTQLCQSGDDNTGGTAIGNTAKKTLTGSCTHTGGDVRLVAGENITLNVNLYNSGGTTRSFTHYWENSSQSFVRFEAYKLGVLRIAFANQTDPAFNESTARVTQCNVTCQDGTCLNTEVYLELWNGTSWTNVSTTGNVTLNGSQANPISLGNYNSSGQMNFTIYGNLHSYNNTLRCVGISTYHTNESAPKNISIIDRTPPTVTLLAPPDFTAYEPQNFTFNYTASDRRLANCTLWGNFSGTWQANATNLTPNNGSMSAFTNVSLDYNRYRWNVLCYDTAGNAAYAPANFTLIVAGDVAIFEDNITFSTYSPVEGQSVIIYANVSNLANKVENGVVVEFWNGTPSTGQLIGTRTVSFGPLGSNLTNYTWVAMLGTHNIHVLVDPPEGSGSVIESDETNNLANRTISTSIWQIYFGNISGNLTLGLVSNDTFVDWLFTQTEGNIYIADTDTSGGISFNFLVPLGQNTTGERNALTDDDFEQLDTLLVTSQYPDSVNFTFTDSGDPVMYETYTVFGTTLVNTPVVNSTANGNFTTGILWDSDDSSNAYFDSSDAEDVVFVTTIHENTLGGSGLSDYEIRIPARLAQYKSGSPTVSFYYEIT